MKISERQAKAGLYKMREVVSGMLAMLDTGALVPDDTPGVLLKSVQNAFSQNNDSSS